MAQCQISVDSEKVKELMIRDDGLKGLVEEVLNQILEAQATEAVGADTRTLELAVCPLEYSCYVLHRLQRESWGLSLLFFLHVTGLPE